MLNHDTRLYPHHVSGTSSYDFSAPQAEVSRHPQNPNVWGLKNLSQEKRVVTFPDGAMKDVEPGRSASLVAGLSINFGRVVGEIRV